MVLKRKIYQKSKTSNRSANHYPCPNFVGYRIFAFHGPTVWNSLPSALHDSSLSLNTCQRRLNLGRLICLDSHEGHPVPLWRFSAIPASDINVMTYLLAYLLTFTASSGMSNRTQPNNLLFRFVIIHAFDRRTDRHR